MQEGLKTFKNNNNYFSWTRIYFAIWKIKIIEFHLDSSEMLYQN